MAAFENSNGYVSGVNYPGEYIHTTLPHTTISANQGRMKTIFIYVTTPTGSMEPSFYTEEVPIKEWAIEQIQRQPFF